MLKTGCRRAFFWATMAALVVAAMPARADDTKQPPIEGLSQRPGPLDALPLTLEQRAKLTEITRDLQRTQWKLVGAIREVRWKQQDALKAPEADAVTVPRLHDEIAALRRQYFQAAIDARKRVEAVLTKERRVELSHWVEPPASRPRVSEERRPAR